MRQLLAIDVKPTAHETLSIHTCARDPLTGPQRHAGRILTRYQHSHYRPTRLVQLRADAGQCAPGEHHRTGDHEHVCPRSGLKAACLSDHLRHLPTQARENCDTYRLGPVVDAYDRLNRAWWRSPHDWHGRPPAGRQICSAPIRILAGWIFAGTTRWAGFRTRG